MERDNGSDCAENEMGAKRLENIGAEGLEVATPDDDDELEVATPDEHEDEDTEPKNSESKGSEKLNVTGSFEAGTKSASIGWLTRFWRDGWMIGPTDAKLLGGLPSKLLAELFVKLPTEPLVVELDTELEDICPCIQQRCLKSRENQ